MRRLYDVYKHLFMGGGKMKWLIPLLLLLILSCKNLTGKTELSVLRDRCIACKECIYVCNADAIAIVNGVAVIDPAKCVECGKCVEVCPNDAIY